jgi:hypothetical protein
MDIINNYLTYEQQAQMCRYSAMIVCAAAIVIGLKGFGKNLVHEVLGDQSKPNSAYVMSQNEKIFYMVLFAAGVICASCHYIKKF